MGFNVDDSYKTCAYCKNVTMEGGYYCICRGVRLGDNGAEIKSKYGQFSSISPCYRSDFEHWGYNEGYTTITNPILDDGTY